MADTDPVPAVTTDPPEAASTSSTPPGEQPAADPVVALGERILAEFDHEHTNSTIARWLAHHTARLLDAADRARANGDPDADARAAEARTAILELWQARVAWPAGWPPPRAAEMARVLDDLPSLGEAAWYRPTVLGRLHDIHHHLLAVLVDLVTGSGAVDIEQGWLEMFGDQLTPDETRLLRRAATTPTRLDALLNWSRFGADADDVNTAGRESATTEHPLIQLANAYRDAILNLVERVASRTQTSGIDT